MRMTRVLAQFAVIALASCGGDGITQARLGEVAILRVGQSAELVGEHLRFGVESVPADSRCPEGAVCVWAGAASVALWLEKALQPRQELLLTTVPFAGHSSRAECLGYTVELVEVTPPKYGTLRQSDYRITLVISAK